MNHHKLLTSSLGLGVSLDIETKILGLGLSLVTEVLRFIVLVSVSKLRLQDS
jgi:hypothetical protein